MENKTIKVDTQNRVALIKGLTISQYKQIAEYCVNTFGSVYIDVFDENGESVYIRSTGNQIRFREADAELY